MDLPSQCSEIFSALKGIPQVQIVIDMDCWGDKTLKKSTYMLYAKKHPVQFTGFKIFFENDIK